MTQVEPQQRVIEYRKTVYLCANGGHDAGVVYLWRGEWYCRACLKRAIRANGGTVREAAASLLGGYPDDHRLEFRVEAVRGSAPMERVTPRNDLPSKPGRVQAKPKEFCQSCGTTHRIGGCPL
jgi:hypothetical protein